MGRLLISQFRPSKERSAKAESILLGGDGLRIVGEERNDPAEPETAETWVGEKGVCPRGTTQLA
jgi:hypothetical protein